MGEKGKRLGRTLGYRASRVFSLGTGGAVAAVALVMVLAPAAMGIIVKAAPYTGVATKFGYNDYNGCETNHGAASWSFTTGIAKESASSSAKTCLKSLGSVGKSSYGFNEVGYDVAVNLKVPNGYHSIATNWAVKATASGSELISGGCPKAVPFSYSSMYTYGSYIYWYNSTGASQYCSADASTYAAIYSWIEDTTSGNTQQNFSYYGILDDYMNTYNSTYWNCYNDTIWNGTGYTYYSGCYGYNTTTTTYAYIGGTFYSSWTGPTSFSNTTSATPTMWFNNTYKGTHHYVLVFEIFVSTNSQAQGWAHSSSLASLNMASTPNQAQLTSITVT